MDIKRIQPFENSTILQEYYAKYLKVSIPR